MDQTLKAYEQVIDKCKNIFKEKLADYGPSWLIFRLPSLTDQILIKAKRIRQLEELNGESKIQESTDVEYCGILNYCVIALIKLWCADRLPNEDIFSVNPSDIDLTLFAELYDGVVQKTKNLMEMKNHDYGEAWKDMNLVSITDQILVKIYRIKNIERNQGKLKVSENIDAQYSDILNYCAFALIRLGVIQR